MSTLRILVRISPMMFMVVRGHFCPRSALSVSVCVSGWVREEGFSPPNGKLLMLSSFFLYFLCSSFLYLSFPFFDER